MFTLVRLENQMRIIVTVHPSISGNNEPNIGLVISYPLRRYQLMSLLDLDTCESLLSNSTCKYVGIPRESAKMRKCCNNFWP